ncbi:MAG: hypothetical protein ABIJ04_11140 [Bacteroidota bacterium]
MAPAVTYRTIPPSPIILTQLNQPVRLYITTAEGPATVKVEQPANPSFIPIISSVSNDSAREVNLTPFLDIIENKPADTVLNYGLRISSNRRINLQKMEIKETSPGFPAGLQFLLLFSFPYQAPMANGYLEKAVAMAIFLYI